MIGRPARDLLSEGGDESAQQYSWLKDRLGVSWQIILNILDGLLSDPDAAKVERTSQALFRMKKLDIEALKMAHAG